MGKIPDFNPYRSGEFTRRSHRASAGRLSTVLAAWVVGWVMYMVAMMAMVYDGFLSVVFQAVVAAAVSGVFVAFVLMLGLILRVPSLGRAWNASPRWAVAIAVASVLVMLGGPAVGIATEYVDPETGRRFLGPASRGGGGELRGAAVRGGELANSQADHAGREPSLD